MVAWCGIARVSACEYFQSDELVSERIMNASNRQIVGALALFAGSIVLPGCGRSYQVAEVEGQLRIGGQPGHKIQIQFIPDVDTGTLGPISTAETDNQGRFVMQLMEGSGAATRPGAVVGWHRVVLSDLQLAASETGNGIPIRLDEKYTLPGSTPLAQEVKEGKQTIEIEVEKRTADS